MNRVDISDHLIHFTKGESPELAFQCLRKIISERRLLGSGETIKGRFPCVCFSEAPLAALTNGLINPESYSKYSPFGILVLKQWLFEKGGRPVIYQTDDEFASLSEYHRWRHMRYEPPSIDFTWEREWRICGNYLEFDIGNASIIVPDDEWAKRLFDEHVIEQDYRVVDYSMVFESTQAEMYREGFTWNVIKLK
jgi:hypothetical protein